MSDLMLRKHLQVSRMFPGNLVTHNRKEAVVIFIALGKLPFISEKVLILKKKQETTGGMAAMRLNRN